MFNKYLVLSVVVGFIGLAWLNQSFLSSSHWFQWFLSYTEHYFEPTHIFSKQSVQSNKHLTDSMRLFTKDELKKYCGINNGEIYLSILGKVFDVTKGRKYYGTAETYNAFAGKDASKSFITGDFSESNLTDDISELSLEELGDLREWLVKYYNDYDFKGKLIGRFYDRNGEPTDYLRNIEKKLIMFDKEKKQTDSYNLRYPPCNVEWSPEQGSKVWCSRQSGGIERDWVGVPRKFYQPGTTSSRCACYNPKEQKSKYQGKFQLYENCNSNSNTCYVRDK